MGYKVIRIKEDVNAAIRKEQARLTNKLKRNISINNALRSLLGMELKWETRNRKPKEDN